VTLVTPPGARQGLRADQFGRDGGAPQRPGALEARATKRVGILSVVAVDADPFSMLSMRSLAAVAPVRRAKRSVAEI
jgi:hypothetical protein